MNSSPTVDGVIVGGGPAGIATAVAMAQAGRSSVVVERSRYESIRIGETLPPEIRLPLAGLGVWERFLNDEHALSPGIASAWGEPELRDQDFLFNPHGLGWHIDRRRFDAMFADVAETQGVEIFRAARVTACERQRSGAWNVRLDADGAVFYFCASVLIDATGRAASPVRHLGGGRIVHDRLIGLVRFVETIPDGDRRTLVEAVEDGWWYSALLPSGRLVAAFMTDADLLPQRRALWSAFWQHRRQVAAHTRSRIGTTTTTSDLCVVLANTSRMQCVAGNGRLAVGDAAAALDPLSAQGVYRALISGVAAARAVDRYLRGDSTSLTDYAHQVEADFADDLRARAGYYRRERRWSNVPFWKRRHGG
jgi:flavin-dependent dehydrogenase